MLGKAIERTKSYTLGCQRCKEITESVTRFIVKEIVSISTVKKPGFHSAVRKLDPQYKVLSMKYFSKTTLPLLYVETRERVTKLKS